VKKINSSRHPGEPRIKSGAGIGVQSIHKAVKTLDSGFLRDDAKKGQINFLPSFPCLDGRNGDGFLPAAEMRRAEQITCLFWLVLAAAVCAGSVRLNLGTPSEPGSGFLPFGTGFLMGILALVHLLQITLRKEGKEEPLLGEVRWERAAGVVGSLILYALLLPLSGYVLTTFFFMAVLFSIYERKKWWVVGIAGLLVVLVTYVVFHHWLKVQFPAGFFRIG
jgi:putative tricarboxylic transport membrane protein